MVVVEESDSKSIQENEQSTHLEFGANDSY
jgi:hypothetical protein